MIAVFARPDHPEGYGLPAWDKPGLRAHGFSVIFVRCSSESQLIAVRDKLARDGLPEPYGHAYQWYGGKMDLIAVLPGKRVLSLKKIVTAIRPNNQRQSMGDNRYAGLYDAEELLSE